MASWADKPVTFTPYVQQLPVEAMVNVGVQKQSLYNQGLQRIQSQIDSVAGLDIARDVDKSYLQSKMNNLGNELKLVAAADFSDFQLVNSVGGMVNQVAKDPNIINAVASTRNYRQGLQEMQQAIKEGKSSPSNEWDFQTRAQDWLNSNDIRRTFTGGYHPYTDYRGHLLEVIKSVTGDSTIRDVSFTTDSNDNVVLTDATTRQKVAGISPEKLKEAIMVGLDPADWKQMELDGRYNYSNIDPTSFAQSVTNSYREKYDSFLNQRNRIKNALNSTTSARERDNLVQQAQQIDNVLKGISDEYENIAETFSKGDVESAKARLYTSNFINGFSRAFSYTETETTQETNPNAVMAMQREIKNQDWKKFLITEERLNKALKLQQEEFEFRKREAALKEGNQGAYGGIGLGSYGRNVETITFADVSKRLEGDNNVLAKMDSEFLARKGKGEDWLKQQMEAVARGGGDTDVVEYLKRTAGLRRSITSNYALLKEFEDKRNKELQGLYDLIPEGSPSGELLTRIGYVKFSPKDFVNFNNKLAEYRKVEPQMRNVMGASSAKITYDDEGALYGMSDKEQQLYQLYKKADSGAPLSEAERNMISLAQHYTRKVNAPFKRGMNTINNDLTDELQSRIAASQSANYNLRTVTKDEEEGLGAALQGLAKIAESQNGKLPYAQDFDVEKAKLIAPNIKQASISLNEPTEFYPEPLYEITLSDGKENMTFRITPDMKNQVFGTRFEPEPNVSAIRDYQQQIEKTGGHTTAYFGQETAKGNAYLDRYDFPSTHYGISGNLEKVDTGTGSQYQFRLNIYDPIEKKWHENIGFPPESYIPEGKVNEVKNKISDAMIYQLLHGDDPEYKGLTKEIENNLIRSSKQPF